MGEITARYYLGFDPGITTGYAVFNEQFQPVDLGQLSFNALCGVLDSDDPYFKDPIKLVVEDYMIYPNKAKAHAGSRVQTRDAIGAIRAYARRKGVQIVFQGADKLDIALRYAGVTMPSDHSLTHKWSAYAHLYYYLVTQGLLKTALEIKNEQAKANSARESTKESS